MQVVLDRHKHHLILTVLLILVSAPIATNSSRSAFAQSQTTSQESKPTNVRDLKFGETLEGELKGGEAHIYRIALTMGQYLHIVVEQKGIDVVVRLVAPDGKQITEVDNPTGTQLPEVVSLIAEVSGEYRLEVKALDDTATAGSYEIKVEELREATTRDQDRIVAERALAEAELLGTQGTAESLPKALGKYKEALSLWRKVEDRQREAVTLNRIGVVYWRLGEHEQALEFYNQALPLRRAVGDRQGEATTVHNIGAVYWQLGESLKALEYYNQALLLRRVVGDRQDMAFSFNAIGLAYNDLGKLSEALEYYAHSLALWRAMGDRRGEANLLANIGVTHQNLGNWQKALEYYNQALSLARPLRNRRLEANMLNSIGIVYWQLGESQKALEYYNQALPLRSATGDRIGEFRTLQAIGTSYKSLGELQKALDYLDHALALARAVGDRRSEASTLREIGSVYNSSGERQKAIDLYNQALLLQRAVADRLGEAITLSNIGVSYSSLGKPEEALEYLRQALVLHRAVGDRDGEAATLRHIARAEGDRGRLAEARTQIEMALKIVESTRSQFVSQQLRTSFSASRQDYYDLYINLLMRMHGSQPSAGYDAAALQATERARARGLLELLTEASIDVRQGMDPVLREKEKALQIRTSWIQSQIIQLNSRLKPDQTKIAGLEDELKKLKDDQEQLETEIRKKHPRYAQLHYPTPLNLKSIQRLLDDKTCLLEYSLGKETSFLFAVTNNEFLAVQLPTAPSFTERVKKIRAAIADKPDRLTLSNYLLNARSLYQDLIQPAARLLANKKSLIIIPDGILHYLPFETLLQSDSGRDSQLNLSRLPYLVRDYSISYVPSATVLANLRAGEPAIQTHRKTFLAYGDPAYRQDESYQTTSVRSAVRSAFGDAKPWDLQQLPETRTEVERIAKLYPREEAQVFLGKEASEENVKERVGQHRFVHFAVHGLLNENKPQYSGLVLSLPLHESEKPATEKTVAVPTLTRTNGSASQTNDVASAEDGLLQVYEIFNLKLNADLVVLSSCETGLGKETKGEGLIGLAQAFFYAGTPSLAVSLWKVQDRSTAELMARFYRHLNNPMLSKAEALRRAQLEMIRGDFSHPYYWASFVLLGQP